MAASNDRIAEVIGKYVDLVAHGTAEDVVALYAEVATVEDPVGTDLRTSREEIREFYKAIEGLEQESRLLTARIADGQAAFQFELVRKAGDQTYTRAPIDVMTFDDDGLITSMRAFWADTDLVVS